ncbi:MAG: transposase [Gemmatimonadota bacterium]|nr:transposase [Gemmatimonadota bacterium]
MQTIPRIQPRPARRNELSTHRIYVHVGWPTLGRLPLMPTDLRAVVEMQLITLCRRLDVEPLAVRATSNRVMLLLRLKPNHTLVTLVSRLKSGSEEALTDAGRGVHWGSGFAASTVGGEELQRVARFISRLD